MILMYKSKCNNNKSILTWTFMKVFDESMSTSWHKACQNVINYYNSEILIKHLCNFYVTLRSDTVHNEFKLYIGITCYARTMHFTIHKYISRMLKYLGIMRVAVSGSCVCMHNSSWMVTNCKIIVFILPENDLKFM